MNSGVFGGPEGAWYGSHLFLRVVYLRRTEREKVARRSRGPARQAAWD